MSSSWSVSFSIKAVRRCFLFDSFFTVTVLNRTLVFSERLNRSANNKADSRDVLTAIYPSLHMR